MKKNFKILDTGNFYFPVMDKGKKFVVGETIDIDIDKKYHKLIELSFKRRNDLFFDMLAKPIWDACKNDLKRYKSKISTSL